jgi:hypothetical protein
VAVLVALIARHPRDCGDEQKCRDRDDDDQKDSAGSHVGSLDWLSSSMVEMGSMTCVCYGLVAALDIRHRGLAAMKMWEAL